MTFKKMTKSVLGVLLVLMLIFSSVSCTESPQVAYDNFFTDLDILYRLEQVAFNVEFGRYSDVWQRDIQSVIDDLETCPVDSEEALRINNMFIKSAQAFLDASQLFLEGSDKARMEGYERQDYAKSKYREATSAYHAYIITEE